MNASWYLSSQLCRVHHLCSINKMMRKNHVLVIQSSNGILSWRRLALFAASLVWLRISDVVVPDVRFVRAGDGMPHPHFQADVPQSLYDNHPKSRSSFFSLLRRREEPNDDNSSLYPFIKSFRLKKRNIRNGSIPTPHTRFLWRQSSFVDRLTIIRSTVPYWAVFTARNLFSANRGKGLALATFVYGMHKFCTSEPVQRSFYFWKHAGPIVVHYKFTKWWLTASHADRPKRDQVYELLHNQYAQPAYDIILHLRGLYVKMGQILSSRPDFMPHQYIHFFTNLQDQIPAYDTELVQATAIEALRKDCPAYDMYEDLVLDPLPLGSASIGQVHRAVLHPKEKEEEQGLASSKEVAIKVMHQGAKEKFQHDFQVFRWLCRLAIPSWCQMLNALEQQVMTEFNYLHEAESLQTVRNHVLQSRYRNRVCIPEPMMDLCCETVLVMEMLHGKKLTEAIQDNLLMAFGGNRDLVNEFLKQRKHEVLMGGHDTQTSDAIIRRVNLFGKWKLLTFFQQCRSVIDLLVDVHGYQIFRTGVWNGDPHFGNCLQLKDGRLGLIDYGQTRRIDDVQRRQFARIVVALHDPPHLFQCNATAVAAAMRNAGFATRNNTDDPIMCRYAGLLFDSDEDSLRSGFSIPQEYFKWLMDMNPLLSIPDSAIFVGRTSLLFRGMGSAIGSGQIRTAARWYPHAKQALEEAQ